MIERDLDSTQIIGGERGPRYRLFYQIACMIALRAPSLSTMGSTLSPGPSASKSNVCGTVTWLRSTTTPRNLTMAE